MAKKPMSADAAKLLGEDPKPEVAEAQPEVAEAKKPIAPIAGDDDGVLAAHLRRQADWEEDAAKIFRGPSQEEIERRQLIDELSKKDAERAKEMRKADEEKAAAEAEADKAARLKRAAELRAEADILEGV